MLRLKDIPETDTPEVIQTAQRLYEQERSESERTSSLADAAEEVGLPREYLERAAQEVHQRRVVAMHEQRRRRNWLLAAGVAAGVAVSLVGGLYVARTSPQLSGPLVPPVAVTTAAASADLATQWSLDTDGRSAAVVEYGAQAGRARVATIKVDAFRPDGQGAILCQPAPDCAAGRFERPATDFV